MLKTAKEPVTRRLAYRPQDLVRMLGLSRSHIYELIWQGKIEAKRTGPHGAIIVTQAALDRWLSGLQGRG